MFAFPLNGISSVLKMNKNKIQIVLFCCLVYLNTINMINPNMSES